MTTPARRAEALGHTLPPLLVAAERVAASVAQGAHGRRRGGPGDTFWQYRPFQQGDSAARIDWRQTAKSDRATLRETEWEAAQTICLWCDPSPSMRWKSRLASVQKAESADLLALALASLLLRGGEHIRLPGTVRRLFTGLAGLENLATAVQQESVSFEALGHQAVPRHAGVVLFSDFLAPLPEIRRVITQLAAQADHGHLVQVLDPAEMDLPYQGRVRFQGVNGEDEIEITRVEDVRAAYAKAMAAQREGLAQICDATGFNLTLHRTDHAPEAALTALYTALSTS